MVCHICGKPASLECPVCRRYACNEHTHWNISRFVCFECFDLARRDTKRAEEDKYYRTHYCDFHKCYHDDEYLKSQRLYLGIVYCGTCKKQMCTDSTIKGEVKEFKGGDPYGGDYDRAWIKVIKYFCPVCKNAVFFEANIYSEAPQRYWCFSTSYKYHGTILVSKYEYKFEWKKWESNSNFDNFLYWETHNIGA